MREYLIKSIILFGILFHSEIAKGCFCITPKDSLEIADVVFKGIANINNDFYEGAECYYCLYGLVEFKIDTIIKGGEYIKKCSEVAILQESSNCSFYFEQDSAYLVYAKYVYQYENDKSTELPFLTTRQCTGTKAINTEGLKVSAKFVEGKRSIDDVAIRADRTTFWNGWFLVSIILNIILLSSFFYLMKKGRNKT